MHFRPRIQGRQFSSWLQKISGKALSNCIKIANCIYRAKSHRGVESSFQPCSDYDMYALPADNGIWCTHKATNGQKYTNEDWSKWSLIRSDHSARLAWVSKFDLTLSDMSPLIRKSSGSCYTLIIQLFHKIDFFQNFTDYLKKVIINKPHTPSDKPLPDAFLNLSSFSAQRYYNVINEAVYK